MKKNYSTFFAFLCFAFLAVLVLCQNIISATNGENAAFYPELLRLHVVANSDSAADQALKIEVRDRILPLLERLVLECENPAEALDSVKKNKKLIEDTAKAATEKNKEQQSVRIETGIRYYPEKEYNGQVFDAGQYLSVRVILGRGGGHNWWCVLFPALREIGTVNEDEAYSSEKQNKEENPDKKDGIKIFGCRVKLKILEYFE